MKKICYVVTIAATIDSFFIPQLKYLSAKGFDVTVVCSDNETLQEKLGDSIRFFPICIPRGVSLMGSARAICALKSFFNREQFDLIQYSTPNAGFYASIAAKAVGCRVRNYHLMGFRYLGMSGIERMIFKQIEKITCANSTHIECVSQSNLEFGVAQRIFQREKATVVWNGSTGGVDLDRFDFKKRLVWRSEIRQELGYGEDDFVFGFIGRITRDKGIDELLEAFFSLQNESKLLFVGRLEDDGTLDSALLEKANCHPKIKFHKAVADIERYYAAIDVLVLPSYREGFGNVVIEAAAMGTPAIVSNIPGPIDAIEDGVTAYTVESRNATDLQEKMEQILNSNFKQIGNAAHKYVATHFDSVVLCEKILQRKITLLGN